MALVAVLWIVGLLALMAAGIGSSGRVSSQLAFNAIEHVKAKALADAGINRAIFQLRQGDVLRSRFVDGLAGFSFVTEEGLVAVQIRDEDGKIDLNFAPPELLRGLMVQAGLEEGEAAETMAARIVDYRDEDQTPLPLGAEDEAYEAAGLAGRAADRPFRQVDELISVLGMTETLYARLRPYVTVFAVSEGFDPLRASDAALRALPGMTVEARALIQTADVDNDLHSILPESMLEPFENYVLPSRDLVFEVRGAGPDQKRRTLCP